MVAIEDTFMMRHYRTYFIHLPIPVYQALGLNRIAAYESNSEKSGGDPTRQSREDRDTHHH